MYLISDLTSTSAWIAIALWAGLAVSLVLLGRGLWRQWRGAGLRPWLIRLAIALVGGGVVLAGLMNGWLGEAGLVYGGIDGRPAEPTPSSVISSWPLVQIVARIAIALGAIALFLMLNTTVVRQRRATRSHEGSLS